MTEKKFNLSERASTIDDVPNQGIKFYYHDDVAECFKLIESAIAKWDGKNMADIDEKIDELLGDDFK